MTLPEGITTATVTVGSQLDFFGTDVGLKVTVAPRLGTATDTIVWEATGQPLTDWARTVVAAPGMAATFDVPHVDQAGFVDGTGEAITNWYYRVEIIATSGRSEKRRYKNFQPLVGQTTIDLDLVPDGEAVTPVTAPSAAVLSINGETGAVVLDAADVGAPTLDALATEASTRANADAALDTRLDALEAASLGRAVSTDGSYGLPAPTGVGFEWVITANLLVGPYMNGVSL